MYKYFIFVQLNKGLSLNFYFNFLKKSFEFYFEALKTIKSYLKILKLYLRYIKFIKLHANI